MKYFVYTYTVPLYLRTILTVLLVILIVAITLCCVPIPDPDPYPIPNPDQDGGLDFCELAGKKLTELKCVDDLGNPTWVAPTGEPYTEVCKYYSREGLYIGQKCISEIDDCSELEAARRTREGEMCP